MLGIVSLWKLKESTRNTLGIISSVLLLIQVLAMRWNVVVGGQLFSKSLRGFTSYMPSFFRQGGAAGGADSFCHAVCDHVHYKPHSSLLGERIGGVPANINGALFGTISSEYLTPRRASGRWDVFWQGLQQQLLFPLHRPPYLQPSGYTPTV